MIPVTQNADGIKPSDIDSWEAKRKEVLTLITKVIGSNSRSMYCTLQSRALGVGASEGRTFTEINYVVPRDSSQGIPFFTTVQKEAILRETNSKNVPLRIDDKSIFSFEYDSSQINVFEALRNKLNFTYRYYSYEKTGRMLVILISALATKLGLSFRDDGLYLPVVGTKSEIFITNDYNTALQILGVFNYTGNWTPTSLHDWRNILASSTYFNKDIFLQNDSIVIPPDLTELYSTFLSHIVTNQANSYPVNERINSGEMPPWMKLLTKTFTHIQAEYTSVLEAHQRKSILDSKFSLSMLGRITGLTGTTLDDFSKSLKKTIPDFEIFVMSSMPSTIENKVREHAKTWKSTNPTSVT